MLPQLALIVLLLGAQAQAAEVDAAPRKTSGIPTYPRLTKLADAAVMERVNQQLAAREADDRSLAADCREQLRAAKQKPSKNSFTQTTEVTFLSPRFLTLTVQQSYTCGGPYPTNAALDAVTYDLTTGAAVTWESMFERGFLPAAGITPALGALYRKKYRTGDAASECRNAIEDDGVLFGETPVFWLDARAGLLVQPRFPHVIEACADEVALTESEIAPYLQDQALRAAIRSAKTR
jgi:hypothetical protein